MFNLDVQQFERMARQMGGAQDQVAYALSRSLNDAVREARTKLIKETWPRSVRVRNAGFMRYALGMKFSNKRTLRVEINDERAKGRGHLKLHADGGIKRARGRLAIPTPAVPRGPKGVPALWRPRGLAKAVVIGNAIFQRQFSGPRRATNMKPRLELMYALARQARIRKDVPFREDFAASILASARRHFPSRMAHAMATRR